MTSLSSESCLLSILVYCLLFGENGGYRFESHPEIDVLTVGDASLDTATIVRAGGYTPVFVDKHIVLLGTSGSDAVEARSIFESLDRIDAEHGMAQGCMQLVEFWFAHTSWTALYHTGDNAADRVAFGLHPGDERLSLSMAISPTCDV